LVSMIERLLKLKTCIKKTLADIGTNDFYDKENFKILEDVLEVLRPTELATKELSQEDSTVLTSEGLFKFLFKTSLINRPI
jgi:hypothetical protein